MKPGVLLLGAVAALILGSRKKGEAPPDEGYTDLPPPPPTEQGGTPVTPAGATQSYSERGVNYNPECTWFQVSDFDEWNAFVESVVQALGGIPAPAGARDMAVSVWKTLFPACPWPPGAATISGKSWEHVVGSTQDALELLARVPRDSPEPTAGDYDLVAQALGGLRE
jgi:hypothetical protein